MHTVQTIIGFRVVTLVQTSRLFQINKGYEFESETDTEVIPKLIKYLYDNRESDRVTFSTLVERVIKQLVSGSNHTLAWTHFAILASLFIAMLLCDLSLRDIKVFYVRIHLNSNYKQKRHKLCHWFIHTQSFHPVCETT